MAGINQIPKLSYWASSTDINKMITSLNQVLIDLQTQINSSQSKAIVAATLGNLPMNVKEGALGIAEDTSFMYYFKNGAWIPIK